MSQSVAHAGSCSFYKKNDAEVLFEKAYGHIVVDTNGREYIDFILGYGPVIIGHANREFTNDVSKKMNDGILFPGYSSKHRMYYERLLEDKADNYTPAFFKTGSEAITAAIRLSSFKSSKKGVIRCGFIGWHDSQIASSVYWHEPLNSSRRSSVRFSDGFRGVDGNEKVYNWISMDVEELNEIIESNSTDIGVLVIDAYQMVNCTVSVIRKVIELCKKNNICIIFDETKTGGRISKRGYAIDNNLDVDAIIMGKALANGAPLSMVIGKHNLMKYAKEARITGTFSKELFSIYCAEKTIDILSEYKSYETIRNEGIKVVQAINKAIKNSDLDSLINAKAIFKGTMFEIEFDESLVNSFDKRENFQKCMVSAGILLLQGHPSFVCLDHQHLNYDELYQKLCLGLCEWKGGLENK